MKIYFVLFAFLASIGSAVADESGKEKPNRNPSSNPIAPVKVETVQGTNGYGEKWTDKNGVVCYVAYAQGAGVFCFKP